MNILLVNPKPAVWHAPKVPPLGLAYVAAALERDGHRVRVWDQVVDPVEPRLAGFGLVGATAVTPQIKAAWAFLEKAKAKGAQTVLGGPHPTCLPDESLAIPAVDYVVRQEGEQTVVELARALTRGKPPEGIAGLSCKRDGQPVHSPDRQPVAELDTLSFPAHHLFPDISRYTGAQPLLGRRTRALPLLTSRGCPHDCSFCCKGVFGRSFRIRSPENVVQEWEYLVKRFHVNEIGIQDDVFNFDVDRAIAICRMIVERGLQVPWCTPNGLRADRVSPELFRAMRESGCERVAFGVESGNQGILDSLGKRETLDQIEHAFDLAGRAGLETMGFFMFGNVGEDGSTMDQTIDLALSLKPTYAQFTMATPYPGTRLYDTVRREGRLLVDDWDRYGHYTTRAFFQHGNVTPALVGSRMKKAYRRFYLRIPFAVNFGLRLSTWKNVGAVARGAWHLLARA